MSIGVNDTVKVSYPYSYNNHLFGKTGVVKEIEGSSTLSPYALVFIQGTMACLRFMTDELELIKSAKEQDAEEQLNKPEELKEPKVKFKKGDIVEALEDVCDSDGCLIFKKHWLYTVEDVEVLAHATWLGISEDPDRNTRFRKCNWNAGAFKLKERKDVNVEQGIKHDQGKIDYTYLLKDLPLSVEEVTKVLMFGAAKYSRLNYSKVQSERYHAAFFRHAMKYLQGELKDPETYYHHLAHAVCCLMFLIERDLKDQNNEPEDNQKDKQ